MTNVRDVFKVNGSAYHATVVNALADVIWVCANTSFLIQDDSPGVVLTSMERLSSPALETDQPAQSLERTQSRTVTPPTTPHRKPNSLPINAESRTATELQIDGIPSSTDIKLVRRAVIPTCI